MRRLAVLLAALAAAVAAGAASAETKKVTVDDSKELLAAFLAAKPGHEITLAPGLYHIGRLATAAGGTEAEPIVLRADKLGEVLIQVRAVEGFVVGHPWWRFENLDIEGACKRPTECEHAFHIVGRASHTVIRHNRMTEFNAMIKGNGLTVGGERSYPNDVLIEDNFMHNSTGRAFRGPVTFVDVVGGRRWTLRGNFLADFAKTVDNRVSYGAFLKGNSRDGVFERNLVICEWRHTGGIRVGLSFGGGGGEPASICEDGECAVKHTGGIMRNNVIMNCPSDAGIYVNSSRNTKIFNNTIFNANGIDVHFPQSSAEIRNNIIAGGIRSRAGGEVVAENNLVTGFGFMNWAPGGARYVKRRLEGQDVKYPNYVSAENVRWAQDLVDSIVEYVGSSWIGRGNAEFESWFVAPAAGDFRLEDGSEIVDRGEVLKLVRKDFCGAPRRLPPHDLGAIEYGLDLCSIRAKLDEAARLSVRR